MTGQELNRDVKRLVNLVCKHDNEGTYADHDAVVKEIRRLYYADDDFKVLNLKSVLSLIRLNGRFRAIPLHLFGINIELDKLR